MTGQESLRAALDREHKPCHEAPEWLPVKTSEARWGAPPSGGWLTFIDPDEVESPNPGYCFKCAGFVPVGFTKDRGLLVLRREVTPHREAPMRLDGDAQPPAGIPADGEEGAIRQQGPEALVAA